jgi:hypothetical protein
MLRVLITLFWVSLIVGTLLAHSVVANWAVTLAALYFTARWWAGRRRALTNSAGAPQLSPPNAGSPQAQTASSANRPASRSVRSRWTVDRLHATERRWR